MVLWYNRGVGARAKPGQAMVEYVLCLVSLLVVIGILWGLVRAAVRHGERTESLVTSDCP